MNISGFICFLLAHHVISCRTLIFGMHSKPKFILILKEIDVQSQIDECIVQTQIYGITKNLDDDLRSAVLNPNEVCFNLNERSTQSVVTNLIIFR